jgi:23S rRNA (uracil1939-C5)-methyltransferase
MLVEIEKLVYGGQGLARAAGKTVLAPYVLPGERVEVEAVAETSSIVHARPRHWQMESADRVPGACPVYGQCGGCHYQHISYAQQVDYKREILRETLVRLGKIRWDGPIETITAEPWGYRNRTQLRIIRRGRKAAVGFFEAGSRRLVEAGHCPINSPALNRAHAALADLASQRRFPRFLHEVEFFTNESDVQINILESEQPVSRSFFEWCAGKIPGLSLGEYIDYATAVDTFRVGSRSFFQVNRFLVERLTQAVLGQAQGTRALDLYSGVGLFTLPLARRFERVIGVDSSRRAVSSLQFNMERAGLTARLIHMNVDEFLAGYEEPVDLIVADPPRAGLGPKVTSEISRLRPSRLVLVSCDPATLARDLRALTAGGYEIERVAFLDLFPQTFHIESVVSLRLPG